MCETMYSDKAISKVIRLIPKLDELKLNETYASTHTVNAVAETQGFLSSIELFDCDVSADQILKLYKKCILLTEIGAPRSLAQDLDDFALEFDMERCGELYFDDDDYDSEDLYLENDEDVNYEFYYENDEDNSDDLFDDNFDNIMHSMMYW
ncbi:hypothetical protein LPJ75_003934 [Coemansia sp. RSA 2598]|nr:hypothetical protein LPJ75_003934 [Coemansia sp. RSA 2598]